MTFQFLQFASIFPWRRVEPSVQNLKSPLSMHGYFVLSLVKVSSMILEEKSKLFKGGWRVECIFSQIHKTSNKISYSQQIKF